MSDDWLIIIPTNPKWLPNHEQGERALEVFNTFVPAAREVSMATSERVQIVLSGPNTDVIACPACGAQLGWEWFGSELDSREASGFEELEVPLPCCAATISLNDLRFDMPMGFARFELSALNPDRDWLTGDEIHQLEASLGHPIRQIFRHL